MLAKKIFSTQLPGILVLRFVGVAEAGAALNHVVDVGVRFQSTDPYRSTVFRNFSVKA